MTNTNLGETNNGRDDCDSGCSVYVFNWTWRISNMNINGEYVKFPTIKQIDNEIARLTKEIEELSHNKAYVLRTKMLIGMMQFEKDRQGFDSHYNSSKGGK